MRNLSVSLISLAVLIGYPGFATHRAFGVETSYNVSESALLLPPLEVKGRRIRAYFLSEQPVASGVAIYLKRDYFGKSAENSGMGLVWVADAQVGDRIVQIDGVDVEKIPAKRRSSIIFAGVKTLGVRFGGGKMRIVEVVDPPTPDR